MPTSPEERKRIAANCSQFLGFRAATSISDKLTEIAGSPYAEQGQDNYGVGGFTEEFENELAALMGKEAAVLMPSGTMAQQIALRIWCDWAQNNRVAFHPTCHLEIHEQGAYRELHHLEATLLGKADRLFTLSDLERIESPISALLIELPQREIGGQLPTWEELSEICDWARDRGIKTHLDGARLWECKPFYGKAYGDIARIFDSVYVSFYKILAGLPGAMLLGPEDFISEARVWLRRHGGNLVSLTPNAIAAKIGMDKHLPNIPSYCRKAAEIAQSLRGMDGLTIVPENPPTNMMHLLFSGEKESVEESLWTTARDTGVLIARRVGPTSDPAVWRVEIGVTDINMGLDLEALRKAMEMAIARMKCEEPAGSSV